jgi:hypothetical protein
MMENAHVRLFHKTQVGKQKVAYLNLSVSRYRRLITIP